MYKTLSKDILNRVPKEKALQLSKNLDKLYNEAEIANKELIEKTNKFAKKTKGDPGFREGLKSKERALEKINADYAGDASRLLDIAGSKVVYNTLDELYNALKILNEEYEILVFKDRIHFHSPVIAIFRLRQFIPGDHTKVVHHITASDNQYAFFTQSG